MTFEIGDKVRLVDYGSMNGETGIVTQAYEDGFIEVALDSGEKVGDLDFLFYPEEIALV